MNACLPVRNGRIVLRVRVANTLLDCLGGSTLIEHQIVESLRVPLVAFR